MDLRIRFNKQLFASIVAGEVVTLMWFYEPLRQRRLFTVSWVATSIVATAFIALMLQLVTGHVRMITSWRQVFTTSLWLGLFFTLLEASQIPGLFTSRAVARAFVHGMHKFTLVFAMLGVGLQLPAETADVEEDVESEGATSEVDSEEGSDKSAETGSKS
ncbi:hypothetical protein NP493_2g01000 [Ridgeia piscesae]|uniref:Uncharacterized protein n=1 Tax=Ridgeia piscesae TaxID=27915 RepID=A0AAD9ULN5_RIDPI|nr:hypothetical protein NP493_2g01000 [Ridgeia piscesae]